MLKFIAHDTVNDVAIIQTAFAFNVRYGLEVTPYTTLGQARVAFGHCLQHALNCAGQFDEVAA